MIFIQGLPCLFVGAPVFFFLADSPAKAAWPEDRQRNWLMSTLAQERREVDTSHQPGTLPPAARDIRVLGMALTFFAMVVPIDPLAFFLPAIVKQMGSFSQMEIGFSRRSDRTGERIYHYVIPAGIGAIGLVIAGLSLGSMPVLALIGFTLAAVGYISTLPMF